MAVTSTRLPENLEDYIRTIKNKGYASSESEAIKLIVLERMMKDKERGKISPFEYQIKKDKKKTRKDLSSIPTDNVERKEQISEGSLPKSEEAVSYFGKSNRPKYQGTREEYENDLKRGTISKGMFEPPED